MPLLRARPHAALSVRELATEVGCSPATLKRRFRRAVGCSVHGYAVSVRVGLAAELLRTGRSVKEAMAAAGFDSRSAFIRRFVAVHGSTPGRYARQHAGTSDGHA